MTMAEQPGLEVVDEGDENQRLQGFYYVKPQPAEACEQARGFAHGA